MCSRFELDVTVRQLCARFRLTVPPPLPNRAEVRPTDAVLAIDGTGARLLSWGLAVTWQSGPLINARAESLSTRPTFRPLLATGRVLVPASAWWEWRVDGKARVKTRLSLAHADLFAMAGLRDGERVVIVTCAPSGALAHIHDRMPVLLSPEAEAAWADARIPFKDLAPLLGPHPGPFDLTEDIPEPSAQGDLFG
ncbi:MAG: SOS response-associated peptidase [Magnetospirillum sp.]|nr:SOS response-associated peptidase [Magnetospirillum sp.]